MWDEVTHRSCFGDLGINLNLRLGRRYGFSAGFPIDS